MPRIRKRKGIPGYRLGSVMDNEIKISTWNVRALGNAGSTQDLERILQDYELDIMTIQDIRRISVTSTKAAIPRNIKLE